MNYEALAYFRRKPFASMHEFAVEALAEHYGGAEEAVQAADFMTEVAGERALLECVATCAGFAQRMAGRARENWTALGAWLRAGLL